jgi:hypothetical protein
MSFWEFSKAFLRCPPKMDFVYDVLLSAQLFMLQIAIFIAFSRKRFPAIKTPFHFRKPHRRSSNYKHTRRIGNLL